MSTNYPGSLDSYTTKVDGVDDVLAAHINDPQDAIEALEAQHQTRSLLKIKNGAGATVAAGDVGYINSAGNFARTTTANLNAAWAVVIVGGANNTQIIVCRRGRVTITLNANCSIGDYLYTSATAGQASVLSYVRPEVLGVALTANTGGAGGTCEALLLTGTSFIPITDSNDIYRVDNHSATAFVATINGAPTPTSVVYNAPSSGHENVINNAVNTQLAKAVLHNTTRGTSRLISSVNTGTNTITTISSTDSWANTDTITIESQTATSPYANKFIELDFSQQTIVNILGRAVLLDVVHLDSGGTTAFFLHPFETYGTGKEFALRQDRKSVV